MLLCLTVVLFDVENPSCCIRSQKYVCPVVNHTQVAACKSFPGDTFGFKIQPPSGHNTRTVKVETLYIVTMEISSFTYLLTYSMEQSPS